MDETEKKLEQTRKILKEMMEKGTLPRARSLTRKERKAFDKSGKNIFNLVTQDDKRTFLAIRQDAADWILDNVFPKFDWDNVENNICQAFAEYVMNLTYSGDLDEKNL